MSTPEQRHDRDAGDRAPGDRGHSAARAIGGYLIGLALATGLTAASFIAAFAPGVVWTPSVPALLVTLAIAQMGVHLVFFLHITTGADNTNNVLALAFGTLIVFLVIAGSLWIMSHLNGNMMPMDEMTRMQR